MCDVPGGFRWPAISVAAYEFGAPCATILGCSETCTQGHQHFQGMTTVSPSAPPLTPPRGAGQSSPPDGLGGWPQVKIEASPLASVSAGQAASRVRCAGRCPPLTRLDPRRDLHPGARQSMKIVREHGLTWELVGADQADHVNVGRLFNVPEPELGLAHALPQKFRYAKQLADATRADGRRIGNRLQALLHLVDQGRRGRFTGRCATVGHLANHVFDGGRATAYRLHVRPVADERATARSTAQSPSDIGTDSPLSMPAW